MARRKQREIASQGGKAAHASGRAHKWTKEQAREAGRKGGLKAAAKRAAALVAAPASGESVPNVSESTAG